jgi:hypothetical protein
MTTAITLGSFFLLALLGLGIYQASIDAASGSTLAGAVVESPSQEQINGCMVECMRSCVTDQDLVGSCRATCEPGCGA